MAKQPVDMSIDVTMVEDFFCDSCHGEFMLVMDPDNDVSIADIKKCVYCGEDLDTELEIIPDSYDIDEWNDDDCED